MITGGERREHTQSASNPMGHQTTTFGASTPEAKRAPISARQRLARGPALVAALLVAWLVAFGPGLGRPAAVAQDIRSLASLTNLPALVTHVPVGLDPYRGDGPKGIDSADFDQDGAKDLAVSNTDGSVTVLFGFGDGKFQAPQHLRTPRPQARPAASLRGIVTGDFNGDGHPDLVTAAPYESEVYLFLYTNGPARFSPPRVLETWRGARNLEAGDFDGDGVLDLTVAGTGRGLQQYRGRGDGTFTPVTNLAELDFPLSDPEKFPKPLYSLQRFRPADSLQDWLVAGHAEGSNIWVLKPNPQGALEINTTIAGRVNVHGLAVGPIFNRTNSPINDLVTILRDTGVLEVRRGTNSSLGLAPPQKSPQNPISLYVPGGPRAVSIVDLNSDGWNDLVVVVRNLDAVVTYTNDAGRTLTLASTRPVGTSPRELVTADFNNDSRPDVAVMNRYSSDLTVLLASSSTANTGYRAVDGLYLVDGNVVGLTVTDFNKDGLDDVIQLHRASGDFSVRLTETNASSAVGEPRFRLGDPVYYTVGNVPTTQVIADLNSDGLPDVVTASLGTKLIERGYVSIRLGQTNAPGTVGPEIRIDLPDDVDARLFALEPGDFNHDGPLDLVVGTLDGKLSFYQGGGDGQFVHVVTRRLRLDGPASAQPRSLAAGDFDGDGDLDLAVLDASGVMWVTENPWSESTPAAHLLNPGAAAPIRRFPRIDDDFRGRKIVATDYNHDGNLDLIIGSGHSAWLYAGQGGPGATNFATPPIRLAAISNLVSDFFLSDLDGDGNDDLVMSCRDRDCFSIFASGHGLSSALPYDAPSSKFVAVGNLDGDGEPDFVGSGRVLWTSLSSHAPQAAPPLVPRGDRPRLAQVVINEILASNTDLPLDADDDRTSDWIEFYNGNNTNSPSLTGWTLTLEAPDNSGKPELRRYTFPRTAFLGADNHLLVICSERTNTLYHTGWRLPSSGGTLTLWDAAGRKVDEVRYPSQRPNISYARYRDAQRSFVFNPFPSPARPNPVNGTAEPSLKFAGLHPDSFQPGQPIRFYAEVAEDIGAVSALVLHYQTLGVNDQTLRSQIQLFDDGAHGDGAANDGFFAGELPTTFSSPTELQFFFELTDLDDTTIAAPEDPEFGTPDALGNAYQIAFHQPVPPLEISEVMAWNTLGSVQEGTDGTPDWAEIRNWSNSPTSLAGIALSQQIGDNPRYRFPDDWSLDGRQHFVIMCDNEPDRGKHHAPFALNRIGDTLMLTGLTTNRSRTLIDLVRFGPQQPDISFARLGARGPFWPLSPTPTNANIAPRIVQGTNTAWAGGIQFSNGTAQAVFAIPTKPGVRQTVEYCPDLAPNLWQPLDQFVGDGLERAYLWHPTNVILLRVK